MKNLRKLQIFKQKINKLQKNKFMVYKKKFNYFNN